MIEDRIGPDFRRKAKGRTYGCTAVCVGLTLLLACETTDGITQEAPEKREATVADTSRFRTHDLVMTALGRERTVRVYLPPGYAESDTDYPVIYFHDAQNLFDDETAFMSEWEVDETFDRLAEEAGLRFIAVGVDNGGDKRMRELSPWTNPRFGGAEGDAYLAFIIDEVKPLIDSLYRTRPGRKSTAMVGSSMGGLMSHYALYRHPKVFGMAGVLSPSYWYSDSVFVQTRANPIPPDARLSILVGAKEGEEMVSDAQRMVETVRQSGLPQDQLQFVLDPDGEHNEAFWRRRLGEVVLHLFSE